MDVGSISAFGDKVIYFKDEVKNISKNGYLGLFTASSSIFLPDYRKLRK